MLREAFANVMCWLRFWRWYWWSKRLDVLRDPPEALAVTLTHDNRAHKDLDGANVFERDLALAGGLVEPDSLAKLLFGNGAGSVDLVTKDQEWDLGELLDGKEGVKLCACLCESLVVLSVDKEDDAVNLGEVVLPKTTSLLVTSKIICGELDLTDSKLFRSCGWQNVRGCAGRDARAEGDQERRVVGVRE